jgi:EAL domain-containing protein (putative c-di-GMP-specific phosphodiesterase class I)
LQRFPLDALKIDRTFINEISAAGEGATILSAMIDIGLSLKHRVIAEGVETREQLHFLQKKGCSEGQGYLFCHPNIQPSRPKPFFKGDLEASAQPLKKLKNGTGLGYDDAFHHQLAGGI